MFSNTEVIVTQIVMTNIVSSLSLSVISQRPIHRTGSKAGDTTRHHKVTEKD